ncbi:MAG: DUF2147 domain-containing protein [Bacteroidetes bacterium]|nr:DUF2147 domain-containing protein [Bacteroidota bacterium]MCL1968522.1 DUF2147 domain-containing protein [Bacteroidota bacterium]
MRFYRRKIFVLIFFFFAGIKTVLLAQNKPDDIVGYYLNEDPFSGAISQVYIYNAGNGIYEGIVIWVNEEDRKKYEGLVFMKDLTFNAKENEWQNATFIYPGKNGKFKAYMRLEKNGQLRVRGYWGISMLGKTLYWPREQQSRNPKIKHP